MNAPLIDQDVIASPATPIRTWWNRPCGARDVLQIALPMVISTGSWSIQLFVDRMFLFWYSDTAMSATMPAGTWYWTLICFPLGICGYVNTFVAQYYGARQLVRIGQITWQGIWLGITATPIFLLLIPFVPWLFSGHSEELAYHESLYLRVMMVGAPAAVIAAAQSSFFSGRGMTRIVMYSDLIATVLNITFDYLWIFGYAGFPEMGITGAAWATVLSQWSKVAFFGLLMFNRPTALEFGLWRLWRIDFALLRRLSYFGGPSGLEFFIEAGAFALLTLMMGRLGHDALTATTLAINVNMIAFVPMIGVSVATSVLVGQQITQGRPDLAARATWTSLSMALAYTAIFGVLYVATPDVFLIGHAVGGNEDFLRVRDLTVVLLRFVAAYCIFDSVNLVLAGAIKGAGDTWFVLGVTILISALGVLACWLGQSLGVLWWWFVLTTWLWARGTIFFLRFIGGKWKKMRVIGQD